MKIDAKFVSIVSGATLLTFGGISLHRSNMQGQNPSTADTTETDLKRNGHFSRNRNSVINCDQSTDAEIVDSRNMIADIIRSSVKAMNEWNSKLSARASNIDMKLNRNINVEAENAWCVFDGNRNLDYKGSGGLNDFLSKFVDNRNGNISGTNNKVVAINNRNLMISGDNNRLDITETRNHNIRPAAIGSNCNTLAIKNRWGYNHFHLQYVGAATINERNYQLGIIHFHVSENGKMVNVKLHNAEDVTLSIAETSSNKVVVRAEKSGHTETLELSGDRVEANALDSINIFG